MVSVNLILGDCLDRMKEIPDGAIDLTVTSPPYDNLRTYNGTLNDWTPEKWQAILRKLYRVTKDGGVVVWVVGDSTVNGGETGSSFKQALFAIECGFRLHDTMIWRKPNFSNPSRTRYHQVFEYMFVLSKGDPTFNAIKDRPNVYAGHTGSFGSNTVTQPNGSKGLRKSSVNTQFGMRHNVWDCQTAGQTGEAKKYGHPAMFPLRLATEHILSWSNVGDTVLDPFLGSGTTGVAAMKTGRRFIGIEREKGYFAIAQGRITKAQDEKTETLI